MFAKVFTGSLMTIAVVVAVGTLPFIGSGAMPVDEGLAGSAGFLFIAVVSAGDFIKELVR